MTPAMELRPLTAADLPLTAIWLERPHVAEWWAGPIALLGRASTPLSEVRLGPITDRPRRKLGDL